MDLTIPLCKSTDPGRSETTGHTVDVRRPRHLHVVPEPVVADGEADVSTAELDDSTPGERGFESVTYLPAFVPTEEEHEDEEALPAPAAAVLPVPRL